MVYALIGIADLLLSVLMWLIIIQVILSWLFAFNVLNTSSGGVRAFVGLPDGSEWLIDEAGDADSLAERMLAAGAADLLARAELVA